jgi:topoisomerase-4 subunit A
LAEVARAAITLIRDPKASVDDVLALLPGPDYPGGGQIISKPEEIRGAYETGRGSITVRARWHVENLARGQWQIVVTELPHTSSARQVQEEIQALVEPRPSTGRKDVSPEQKRTRQFILDLVESVRDESDRKAKLRLVIEPRSSRQSAEETMNALLVHTSLETKIPVNMTWIGLDGLPDQKESSRSLKSGRSFASPRCAAVPSTGCRNARTGCISSRAASRRLPISTKSSK